MASNGPLNQISEGNVNSQLNQSAQFTPQEKKAAWYEQVITWFILLICDGFRAAIAMALKENISIDDILFNKCSTIRLSIFNSGSISGGNAYLSSSGMLGSEGVINKYFILFRNIAIVVYIVMLLYMAVRVLLSSTGKNKEKYKTLMGDWVKGVIILAFFPYIMKYTIVINDAIVMYVDDVKKDLPSQVNLPTLSGVSDEQAGAMNLVDSDLAADGDIMQTMRITASKTGRVAYAMIYLFLIKQLFSFMYIYAKRLVSVIFLIIIFPLVTISYAIDKIADGKSQAFNNWFREYVLNVFMQTFQAINYMVVMSIIYTLVGGDGAVNVILVLVGIEYVSKGDVLLRGLFDKMSGGGAKTVPGSLSEATSTVLKVKAVSEVAKKVGNVGKSVGAIGTRINKAKNTYYESIDKKYTRLEDEKADAAEKMKESIMNPEKHALDNVAGNMQIALNTAGARTSEEVKKSLDRIQTALNDPNRREKVLTEFENLSVDEKNKLEKLLEGNEAINASLNNNKGTKGRLTEKEININAKITLDIHNGGNSGVYKDLYAYMNTQLMKDGDGNVITKRDGTDMSMDDYLVSKAKERTLNYAQNQKVLRVQSFLGNTTGIDTSAYGVKKVSKRRNPSIKTREKTEAELMKEASYASDKMARFGSGASNSQACNRAAELSARLQSLKENMDNGLSDGCSVTEAMELAIEWRELLDMNDASVNQILNNGGIQVSVNGTKKDVSLTDMLGFGLDELEAMASVAAVTNSSSLEGSNEEKEWLTTYAGKTLAEISSGKRFVTDSKDKLVGTTDYAYSKSAMAIVQRAEVDDYVYKSIKELRKGVENGQQILNYRNGITSDDTDNGIEITNYVRPKSQEEARDTRVLESKRKEAEKRYATKNAVVAGTKTQMFRDLFGKNN